MQIQSKIIITSDGSKEKRKPKEADIILDNKVKIYQFRDPTQILTYQINTVSPF